MTTLRIIIAISFLVLFPFVPKAQHKYEREYRVKSEMIPKYAKNFIDSIGSESKVKWYKEISLVDITIEAKFQHNQKTFSVEFDTLGTLQDVEFVIKKRVISPEVYNKMETKLDSLYEKWKFQKIQLHYKGNSREIINAINENQPNNSIKIFYEIVLTGKNHGLTQQYEVTFNAQGDLQNNLQIIQDKADYLEY